MTGELSLALLLVAVLLIALGGLLAAADAALTSFSWSEKVETLPSRIPSWKASKSLATWSA